MEHLYFEWKIEDIVQFLKMIHLLSDGEKHDRVPLEIAQTTAKNQINV